MASLDQMILNAAVHYAAIEDDPQKWYRSVEEYKQRYLVEALKHSEMG